MESPLNYRDTDSFRNVRVFVRWSTLERKGRFCLLSSILPGELGIQYFRVRYHTRSESRVMESILLPEERGTRMILKKSGDDLVISVTDPD